MDHRAERAEHLVAAEVARAVVDRLQSIDVDHQHAESAVAATRPADLLLEGQEQLGAVEEAGQRVGAREIQHALHGAALVRGVGDGHEGEQPGGDEADGEAKDVLRTVGSEVRIHGEDPGERDGREAGGGRARRPVRRPARRPR